MALEGAVGKRRFVPVCGPEPWGLRGALQAKLVVQWCRCAQ